MRIRRQRSSARSLPRRATRPPARFLPGTTARHDKTLAGPPGKALAEDANRAPARPTPAKSPPPFACSCQPKPAWQAPAWQHTASRPTRQAPAWRHADLREDPTTAPPQLPACLHCRCQNRRISGRGSRTVRLRRVVTGGGGPHVYPGSGPLDGGNTLHPA